MKKLENERKKKWKTCTARDDTSPSSAAVLRDLRTPHPYPQLRGLRYTDRTSFQAAVHELERLMFLFEDGQKVDAVAAGGGVTRMAVAESRSSETKDYFLLPEVVSSPKVSRVIRAS